MHSKNWLKFKLNNSTTSKQLRSEHFTLYELEKKTSPTAIDILILDSRETYLANTNFQELQWINVYHPKIDEWSEWKEKDHVNLFLPSLQLRSSQPDKIPADGIPRNL